MTHGRKPRKPRPVRDPIRHALHHATGLTPAELAELQGSMDICIEALRRSRHTEMHIDTLDSIWLIAAEIEASGIVRGFVDQIGTAQAVIDTLRRRCSVDGAWQARPLYGPELCALQDMAHYHMFQLRQVSAGELHRITKRVIARHQSTGGQLLRIAPERLGFVIAP